MKISQAANGTVVQKEKLFRDQKSLIIRDSLI